MKKFFELFGTPVWNLLKSQLEFEFDIKALARFVLWIFSKLPMAEIAERIDPIFKGKKLFEKLDDMVIFEELQSLKKWAEEKVCISSEKVESST